MIYLVFSFALTVLVIMAIIDYHNNPPAGGLMP
jgi:hypothetical protein